MVTGFTLLTLALYGFSAASYAAHTLTRRQGWGQAASLGLVAGLLSHYLALLQRSHWVHAVPYDDIYGSVSLLGWFLGLIYWLLERFYHERVVGTFVAPWLLPLAWVGVYSAREANTAGLTRGSLFALHVTLTIFAYAGFALAGVLSAVYLVQAHGLRGRHLKALLWRLPPLESLERMSRGSVWMGLVALLVGTGCGLLWQRKTGGQFLLTDPKVVATAILTILYVLYLRLWNARRWRGTRASLLCVLNFAVVLFSYTAVNLYFSRFHRYF